MNSIYVLYLCIYILVVVSSTGATIEACKFWPPVAAFVSLSALKGGSCPPARPAVLRAEIRSKGGERAGGSGSQHFL